MKRLAFLSFTIATLIAPIEVQAQKGCVRFPQRAAINVQLLLQCGAWGHL